MKMLIITGNAGSGKTSLLNLIREAHPIKLLEVTGGELEPWTSPTSPVHAIAIDGITASTNPEAVAFIQGWSEASELPLVLVGQNFASIKDVLCELPEGALHVHLVRENGSSQWKLSMDGGAFIATQPEDALSLLSQRITFG